MYPQPYILLSPCNAVTQKQMIITFFFRLILLILIKKSLTTLEREISSLLFHLDDEEPENHSLCKEVDDNDVDAKLIKESIERSPV